MDPRTAGELNRSISLMTARLDNEGKRLNERLEATNDLLRMLVDAVNRNSQELQDLSEERSAKS